MEFELLADSIKQINDKASSAAKSAVNQLMTLRNWAIGYYIVEYEQDGSDRAEYGSHLLKNLEKQIDQKGMNYTLFKACRQFYKVYPQIGSTVSSKFKLPDFGKSSTVSNEFVTDPDVLVNNLSFSHIREIMVLNDAFERFFYETECMKCNWNVRELRREIKTNLYVRAGISRKPDLLLNDAVTIPDVEIEQVPIIKGDAKSASIAAASIVAKVTRDRMMKEYDTIYPGYDFAKNKGYGTKAHIEGIKKQGICDIHRRTFVKKYI